jgi:GxxExxY protein
MKPQTGADPRRPSLNEVTERIIGCAYQVSRVLGSGFVEKVYENALAHELRKNGLKATQQSPIKVVYDGVLVGEFFADILVEDVVIVELKVVRALDNVHLAQGLNYLKATGLNVCLLFNFGTQRVQVRRIVNQLPESDCEQE